MEILSSVFQKHKRKNLHDKIQFLNPRRFSFYNRLPVVEKCLEKCLIRLKKLYFHGKCQNHFTHKSFLQHLLSTEIYLNQKLNLHYHI